jgi:hypothetical protein
VKCKPQQSLFVSIASYTVGDIQEGLLKQLSVLKDANTASLFDDEQTTRAI